MGRVCGDVGTRRDAFFVLSGLHHEDVVAQVKRYTAHGLCYLNYYEGPLFICYIMNKIKVIFISKGKAQF